MAERPKSGPNPSSSTTSAVGKMKLLRRRQSPHHPPRFKKYYRWILWLILSLYLFLSSLSRRPSSTSLSLPLAATPPSPAATLTTHHHHSLNLRIYIYELPHYYNRAWLSNPRCSSHLFAAEVALHETLLTSPFRTLDPFSADLFFVPVYVACNFSTPNGFPSLGHARPLLSSAVNYISSTLPYWNRSGGSDHVFVASHDFGACFSAMAHVAAAVGIPEFLRRSIILQTFGVMKEHPCQAVEHVLIPPYVPPEIVDDVVVPEAAERDIFAFFRGKMEVHPKNISGRYYSRRVRTEIWRRFSGNRRFHLQRKRFSGYRSEIARSVFCLCPLGWAPWSPRLVESVALGCVPVIIADGIRLPFPDAVPWPEISLTVPERDVGRLEAVLDRVAATNLTAIQRRLWDPAVRRALLFHRRMRDGDATWQVLKSLQRLLDRPTGGRHVAAGWSREAGGLEGG